MPGRLVETATASIPRTLLACLVVMAPAIAVSVWAFRLTIFGAAALYFVVWWTLLFAILPFRASDEGAPPLVPGQDPGAPHLPQMRRKALWTTLVSDAVFLVAVAALPLAGL